MDDIQNIIPFQVVSKYILPIMLPFVVMLVQWCNEYENWSHELSFKSKINMIFSSNKQSVHNKHNEHAKINKAGRKGDFFASSLLKKGLFLTCNRKKTATCIKDCLQFHALSRFIGFLPYFSTFYYFYRFLIKNCASKIYI